MLLVLLVLVLVLVLLLLLLLLTPNNVHKKTENRILLNISGLGPSTDGKGTEKRKAGTTRKLKKMNYDKNNGSQYV